MNRKLLVCLIALPLATALIPTSSATAQTYKGTTSKSSKSDKEKTPASKPEDWKVTAPDTTGLNFKGKKTVTLALATDDKGKLVKADVTKSSGDATVDKRVSTWALQHWTGPKSGKATVPVTVGE
jgi:hypothetical protein